MKFFISLLSLFVLCPQLFATEIEVTSEDCNFEVRKERDGIVLRVNKIIALSDSISSWEIELPHDRIKLPLQKNLKTKFLNLNGEETVVTYKNGILTYDQSGQSNFFRDTLVLDISSNLKDIRSAKFTRRGTGILSLFGTEKFECRF